MGDSVAIPIPMVDRDRGDPRNILGVILVCDEQNMYTIAVKSKYAKINLSMSTKANVHTVCTATLRQAVKATTSGGQGLFRCDYGNGKN